MAKNAAAQALRAIPSEKRQQASRENGKKGGRPKKVQPEPNLVKALDTILKDRKLRG